MGTIQSNVGVFSGINSGELIEQLLAIEGRPKQLVQQRIATLQRQRAAILDVNSAVLALRTAARAFDVQDTFKSAAATSSNEDVLTASAANNAALGSFSFQVKRLVTTQQQLSRGFTDAATAGAGITSLTFETGRGGLSSETRLSELNGGVGVERGKIQITDAQGKSAVVDLSTAVTVQDVLDAINSTSGISVRAGVSGDQLTIEDTNTTGTGALKVADAFGYTTATSLGIAKTASPGAGFGITGNAIRTLGGASALSTLNDGNGVAISTGLNIPEFTVTARDGTVFNIVLGQATTSSGTPPVTTTTQTRATTIQDVITAINTQTGGKVTAALKPDNTGLVLTDTSGGAGNLIVRGVGEGRTAAADLGIETVVAGVAASTVSGKRLISGLNSTLTGNLRGGSGLTASDLVLTDRQGQSTSVTIDGTALAGSVEDVISSINEQLDGTLTDVRVRLNRAGNGLELVDTSGGTGNLIASGGAATQLGIATAGVAASTFGGANLQTKWLSRATSLSSLNGGRGLGTGEIRITDASGASRSVNVTSSLKTVDELIRAINAPGRIEAEINANGDGLVIRDISGGGGTLTIEDLSGTVGKTLGIVGTDDSDEGSVQVVGSFEKTVTFAITDSLDAVSRKINEAGVGVAASVVRDGSGAAPFRLSLTARSSGTVGRTIVDSGSVDLGLRTLSEGDDAVAFYGADDPARAVLLTTSTNTLDQVIQGVTIDLKGVSQQAVTVNVTRDTEAIEKSVEDFVKAYNGVLDRIDKYDTFNADTNTRGALFGDSTINTLEASLRTSIQGRAQGVSGEFTRLFEVGLSLGEGGRLSLDREQFRAALEAEPENVEALFAARALKPKEPVVVAPGVTVANTTDEFTSLGVAEQVAQLAERLTSGVNGTLTRRGRTIDEQVRLSEGRIDSLDQRLAARRTILERQFLAMEQAIAQLQTQSSAIGRIGSA